MPSPIAHLGAGYVIYRLNKRKLPLDRRRLWVLPLQLGLVAVLSMLPDLDVIPAFLFGDMQRFHNSISHSLGFGALVSLLVAAGFYAFYRSHFWQWFLVSLWSYWLHVVLDFFSGERGVMLFWPFTVERFASPVKLFYGVQWGLGWISIWHLWTILTEAVYVVAFILAANFLDSRIRREYNARSENN